MKQISKTYRRAAAIHNTLGRAEKTAVMVALGITVAKLIAAVVMNKTRKQKTWEMK